MKTVYEIYEGPQSITVISPDRSKPESKHQYISLAAEDLPRRSRTYTVTSPEDIPAKISKYFYQTPQPAQQESRDFSETVDRKFTFHSESPSRGRSEERSIEVVMRKHSPARTASPHPRSILRAPRVDGGKDKDAKSEKSKSSTSTTLATVGGSTAVTTTTTRSRKSSFSSSESSPSPSSSPSSSTTSFSQRSVTSTLTDFSSRTRTSSRTGTFHFAYGPHISPSQLRRQVSHKKSSCRPVALGRLLNYTWYINSRGVANLASCPPSEKTPAETDADIVWGLLYNLDPDDEFELDVASGWSPAKAGESNRAPSDIKDRPWKQGDNDSNKHFLMVEAVDWFIDPRHYGLPDEIWTGDKIRAMTYIDETNVGPGRIQNEYITRMSEAVATAISYGIPRGWIDNVMRMYGIKPRRRKNKDHKPDNTSLEIKVEEEEEEGEETSTPIKHDEKATEGKDKDKAKTQARGDSSKGERVKKIDEEVTVRRRRRSNDRHN